MSRQDLIQAQDLRFAYRPGLEVLHGVTVSAGAGKLMCVLGRNGSGKTTLLRLLLRRLKPSAGRVLLDGRSLGSYGPRELARATAYVPQNPTSAFEFPVREIVMMGRLPHGGALGLAGKQDLEVARLAMEMTGSAAFADRTLDELSGGEAQCVMIARALAQQPKVMLLDEPTSHLDMQNQLRIYRMMRRLAEDWGMCLICVSHDINMAARFADELVVMRDGSVLADGPPREVVREKTLSDAYGVEVELIDAGADNPPIVRAH
ncbi:MAG: ABC transporter ATP-binding protein [Phycisphaerae bacterium]